MLSYTRLSVEDLSMPILLLALALTVALTSVKYTSKRYDSSIWGLGLRFLVSVLLAASAMVVMLVVCEVGNLGDTEPRAELWRKVTGSLLFLLGFVVPAVHGARYWGMHTKFSWIAFCCTYIVYLVAFTIAAAKLPVEREVGVHRDWFAVRQDLLACISCIGITAMAALCGVSSVSAPYIAFIAEKPHVTEVDLARIRQNIAYTDTSIVEKEMQVSRLRMEAASKPSRNSHNNLVGMIVGGLWRSEGIHKQLSDASEEVQSLRSLRKDLIDDAEAMEAAISQQKFSRTTIGRLHAIIYAFFASYCIYRVINGYFRMGWWAFSTHTREPGASAPRDALVATIAKLANHIIPQIDTNGWVRIVGIFMSGCVFIAALSGVLRTVKKIIPRHSQSSSVLDPLLVANICGVYVLSIATTLRLNLPKEMSGPITTALQSPLLVPSVQLWNDIVLCGTSTIMIVLIYGASHVRDEPWDEETPKAE